MKIRNSSKPVRRAIGLLLFGLAGAMALPPPAHAENFFESFFGSFMRPQRPEPLPSQVTSYADTRGGVERERPRVSDGGGSPSVAYCVRTCDGRYFPIQRHAHISPVEVCHSLCPAAETVVLSGSKIDRAVGPKGTRYADLANAFVYRTKVVDGCTCNGKDAFGLARLNVANDPTLRQGDIVATSDGLATYQVSRHAKTVSAEFTPIDASASAWNRRLSEIKVAPHAGAPVAEEKSAPRKKTQPQASR